MKTPSERYWEKVNICGPDECWPWLASTVKGYGMFFPEHGHSVRAHRFGYELAYGPIPEGLTIDHVRARGCTRRDCQNPAHLEAVTIQENIRRGGDSIKTHCPAGHPYDEANTWRNSEGRRWCRACKRESARRNRKEVV